MEATQKALCLFLTVLYLNLLLLVNSSHNDNTEPVVKTNLGKIRGTILKSDNGADYFAFRGIPFGKPPVKELRFKAPQAVVKWDGILDATDDGHLCIQFDLFSKVFTGDEDCLNLNVYSPKLDGSLAVLFFIHGGGYFSGAGVSSLYGAQRFMDKDVVLVTINYRLGAFGFLSTGDEASPGNYGMLDQVLALRWVRDNIAAFGGDPNRVTVFGESAGGASCALHMLSPLSKGLFHGAIPQSGTATSEWASLDNLGTAKNNAEELAAMINCPTDCTKKLIECLRKRSALDITVKTALQAFTRMNSGGSYMTFVPVVDKSINGDKAFLPDKPTTLLKENKFSAVPTITGVTKDEALLLLAMFDDKGKPLQQMHKGDALKVLKAYSSRLFKNAGKAKTATELFNEHLKHVDESNLRETLTAIISLLDEPFMDYPADETIELLTKHKVPTFAYKLSHRGQYSSVDKLFPGSEFTNRDWQMVTHLDDLQYLFRCNYFTSTDLPEEDKKMADIMLTLWTNFAKTKVPTLEGSTVNYAGFEWLPATTDHIRYLDLTLKPQMVNGRLSERYDIWKNLYDTSAKNDEL